MATIRRVTIHRLRNVKSGCTFELHSGLNVLLGQNGTGKTTLLQWIADFMSGDLESWSKEPYRVEIEFEVGSNPVPATLQVLIDNEISEFPQAPEAPPGFDRLMSSMGESPRASLLTTKTTIQSGDQRYEIHDKPNQIRVYANGDLLAELDAPLDMRGLSNLLTRTIVKAMVALRSTKKAESTPQPDSWRKNT